MKLKLTDINQDPERKSEKYDLAELLSTSVGPPTADRIKYIDEWKREHKDRIKFYLPKGGKDFLKAEAAKCGLSLTVMIKSAIKEYLERNTIS